MPTTTSNAWHNKRWNSLKGPDADVIKAIFQDLSNWLRNPYFEEGINLGDGGTGSVDVTTGVGTAPTTAPVNLTYLDDLSDVPDDGGTPGGTTGLTLTSGVKSIFATWDASTAIDVENGWGQYRVQLDTSNTFPSPDVDKVVGGTFTSFTGLTTGTTYYVRVAAVDAFGNQGAYSSVVSAVPSAVANIDIATGTITGDRLVANTVTAGQIAADTITANELAAINVEVGKYIQSASYSAGSSGWSINGAGDAEFNDVVVRGEIHIGDSTGMVDIYNDATFGGVIDVSDQDGETWQIHANESGGNHNYVIGSLSENVAIGMGHNGSSTVMSFVADEFFENGISVPIIRGGVATGTTDVSGTFTVSHGLGTTPSFVVVSSNDGGEVVTSTGFNSSTFSVFVAGSTSGTSVGAGISVGCYWVAGYYP